MISPTAPAVTFGDGMRMSERNVLGSAEASLMFDARTRMIPVAKQTEEREAIVRQVQADRLWCVSLRFACVIVEVSTEKIYVVGRKRKE